MKSQQIARDNAGGPHGKNLTEGGFEGSGPGDSIEAEPGSKDDPARLAEGKFEKQNSAGAGSGPRQGVVSAEQPFGALGGDSEA